MKKKKEVKARISTKLILLGLVLGLPIVLFSARQNTEDRQRASTNAPVISHMPSSTIGVSPAPPACIPRPACLRPTAKPRCELPQPAIGWCPPSNIPLTDDQINTLLIYVSTVIKNLKK